jgi:hypothetical protein
MKGFVEFGVFNVAVFGSYIGLYYVFSFELAVLVALAHIVVTLVHLR